jgi:hypothetical protein
VIMKSSRLNVSNVAFFMVPLLWRLGGSKGNWLTVFECGLFLSTISRGNYVNIKISG